MTRTKIKQMIAAASASVVLVLGMAGGIAAASANPNAKDDDGHKVTICHRTNSVSNPYTVNSVDFDAATGALKDNGNGDHTNHTGPVFNPNTTYPTPHNGDQWGDIIPPYTWDEGGHYDGLNWTAEGQAVYNNGECNGVYTPPTGGSGGETPSNPQVLGESTQVTTKPVGSVAAGNGGAKELSPASVVGLTGSLAVLVTGAAFAVKRFVRL
jgi:hypothetical protein